VAEPGGRWRALGDGWRALGSASSTPWYPGALMVGFLLNAYAFAPVHPLAAFRSLVGGVAVAIALTVLFGALLRHPRAGGLAAGIVLGVTLGWGRAGSLLAAYLERGLAIQVVIGAGALVALVVGGWLFRWYVRRPEGWGRVTYGLNIIGLAFVAVATFGALRAGALQEAFGDLFAVPRTELGSPAPVAPDIYLVMADGYPRADVIERVQGFRDPLPARLGGLGFEVGESNGSNYVLTPYTLMSMFHMRHVPDIAEMEPVLRGEAPFHATNRRVVNRNPTFELLRRRGYEIVTVAPPWEDVALREADIYLDSGGLNEFEVSLVQRSALGALLRAIAPDLLFEDQRARVRFALDQLERLSEQPSERPRLVFVHLVVPHMPAIFGPDGEPVRTPYEQFFWVDSPVQRGMTRDEYRELARGQIRYTGQLLGEAMERLVASDPEAVVVLFGDHGSGVGMDWSDVPGSDLGERFANLFAARTPGRSGVFDVDGTLVNVFPGLLGSYFGVDVPRQPDLHWAWRDGRETELYVWEGEPG
jgi:hypothetical protein